MTVSNTASKWQYAGTGTRVDFEWHNKIFQASDLLVYVDGVLTGDYTLAGVGDEDGGTVTLASAPANGAVVTLLRAVPALQGADFPIGGPFPSETVETGLDRAAVIDQQLQEQLDRALQFLSTDANLPSAVLPTLSTLKGKLLAFGSETGAPYGAPFDPPASTGQVITPEDYGAVGDGVADDATALQAAGDAAIANSQTLVLDRLYRITTPVVFTAGITIRGRGRVYADADMTSLGGAAVDIYLPPTAVLDITALDNTATRDFSSGLGTATSCAKLTLSTADAAQVSIGDIIKVISNDLSTGLDEGIKYRGEFARVQDKVGDDIYTTAPLTGTYTTSPRLAILAKDEKVTVEGPTFSANYAAGEAGNWNYTLLRIAGAVAPTANVRLQDGNGRGMEVRSCIGARITGSAINMLNENATEGIPGYGFQDGSGGYNIYMGIHVENCRHGFTTVHHTTNTADPWTYGRSRSHMVVGGTAFGCSANGFDTHSDARECQFTNCIVVQPYSESGLYGGFQIRGARNRIQDCIAIGGRIGFQSYKQYVGEGGDHVFDGIMAFNAEDSFRLDRGDGMGSHRATVRNFNFETTANSSICRISEGTAIFSGGVFRQTTPDANAKCIHIPDDGAVNLRVEDCHWEVLSTGAAPSFLDFEAAGCTFDIARLRITGAADFRAVVKGDGATDIDGHFLASSDVLPEVGTGVWSLGSGSNVTGRVVGDGAGFDQTWRYLPKVSTNSGTTVVLSTAVPWWANEIEILMEGVGTNTATEPPILQLGTASGYEVASYIGTISTLGVATTAVTDGFYLGRPTEYAGNDVHCVVAMRRWDDNEHRWFMSATIADDTIPEQYVSTAFKVTAEAMDRMRLTTPGGAALFDSGQARIRYR